MEITRQSNNVSASGHEGTWYTIDEMVIGGKSYFLMEHEKYGDEVAGVILDNNGAVVMEDVFSGFEDFEEFLAAETALPIIGTLTFRDTGEVMEYTDLEQFVAAYADAFDTMGPNGAKVDVLTPDIETHYRIFSVAANEFGETVDRDIYYFLAGEYGFNQPWPKDVMYHGTDEEWDEFWNQQSKEMAKILGDSHQRLFVDMDGTLAEFQQVDRLETLYEPGYFKNLAPMEQVVKAVREIYANHPEIEVHILSAYLTDSPHALVEKNQWLDQHLPEIDATHRVFVPCGVDKKEHVPGGIRTTDFLLDDYTLNLNQWEPPARGIKLLNGINHTKGTWQGDRIRFDTAPEELAGKIVSVMRGQAQIQENNQEKETQISAQEQPQVESPAPPAKTAPKKGRKYTPDQVARWKQEQKEELEQLKQSVSILDYARDQRLTPKKVGNRYYELAEHGSMRIDPTRNCFFYNAGGERGSIVDFIKVLNPGMDNAEAIQELKEYAGVPDRSISSTLFAAAPKETEQRPFSLPERFEGKYSRLYAYLTKSRSVDFEVVSHLVKRDMLYEDQRHNCVFVGYDQEGIARYAGLRTTITDGNFKGEAPSSSKDVSWYICNGAKSLFVCEAPIDVMSVMTLLKQSGLDFRSMDYLSLGGVAPNALLHHLQQNPTLQKIFLGLDKDKAGNTGRQKIKEALQAIGFPGKVLDKLPSKGKDWNQELCLLTEGKKQERATQKNLELAIER